jgi:hypothetical protein
MNQSIYVRVPIDIAHIIALDNQLEVKFGFEDIGNELPNILTDQVKNPESA